MSLISSLPVLFAALALSNVGAPDAINASFFEGQWALHGQQCGNAENWTLRADSSFHSADISGNWQWTGEKLVLKLVDMAVNEESGESGEKFEIEGPINVISTDNVEMVVAPEIYKLKRCS